MKNSRSALVELKSLIDVVNFTSNSADPDVIDKIKAVYTHMNDHIMKDKRLKRKVPPLQVFTYEARKVLYPDLLYDRIPELLDLLYNIERYRGIVAEKAKQAIAFDKLYKHQRSDVPGLNVDEIKVLEVVYKKGNDLRQIYLMILMQFCQMDIYHRWTTLTKASEVLPQLLEYFPKLYMPEENKVKPRPFFLDMSEEEQEQLNEIGEDCRKFIMESLRWAEVTVGKEGPEALRHFIQSDTFAARYPCTVDFDQLLETSEFYMHTVEMQVSQLEHIFPPVAQKPA